MPRANFITCFKMWSSANPAPRKERLNSLCSYFEPDVHESSSHVQENKGLAWEPTSGIKHNSDRLGTEAAGSPDRDTGRAECP